MSILRCDANTAKAGENPLPFIALLAALLVANTPAMAADAAKGERVFKKCMACHSVADKANKVGPYLTGIVGRAVATAEGYAYSEDMKAYGADGKVWDEATLASYLENPKAVVAKTKMAFAGLKKQDEREDLIAYLATKK